MGKLDNLRSQVWEKVKKGGTGKLAMLYIAEKTRSGVAKVKVSDIAKACCVSERQAQNVMSDLIEDGYLHVVGNENGGSGQPRIYKITGKKGEEFSGVKGCRGFHPLYICIHKQNISGEKTPLPGLIAVGDEDVNITLMARGL